MRAKKERLTDGYPGKPGAIRQGVRDPSSQLFSVVEDLEATDDCRMATPESRQARQREGLRPHMHIVEKLRECSTTTTWCNMGSAQKWRVLEILINDKAFCPVQYWQRSRVICWCFYIKMCLQILYLQQTLLRDNNDIYYCTIIHNLAQQNVWSSQ
ncbi:hypothetical protein RB195_003160 [Necator americanus]|uniref:Uncharacterized protein n=1 Tax=Necator americanus TaxID=51031 RepID=A0ABR1DMA6_NECAM